jgi:hypothetical protein
VLHATVPHRNRARNLALAFGNEAEFHMSNKNQGSSGKVASNPARPADREGGPNASSKQPTHSAPPNDGRHGEKHGGHDLDSGQHSTSGSRSR